MKHTNLEVINFIISQWQPYKNDKELLSILVNYFGQDVVVLGIVDLVALAEGVINVYFEQYISDEIEESVAYNLKQISYTGAFRESFEERKVLIINDYENYGSADPFWKGAGLKSVVSVPVERGREIYGVLQIASLKPIEGIEDFVDDLELFANVMALVLSESLEKYRLDLHRKTEDMHIAISTALRESLDGPIEKWLEGSLRKILEFSGAEITGFIMPPDDIYCVVDRSGKFTVFFNEVNDKVKDWIVYKLYKANVNKTVTYKESLKKLNLLPSIEANKVDVVDGLFVPIEYNGQVVASFAYGFTKEIENIAYHKIFLKNIGFHLVMAILSFKRLKQFKDILTKSEEQFVKSFMKMSELRDSYTHGHSERVAYYSKVIGEALGFDDKTVNKLYTAGLLHDIGKIGIPDSILLKPGRLSKHEFEIVKYHAVFSYEMIRDIDHLKPFAECVRHHHERCDGSGYPDGLLCNQISMCAKVLAIADVFDALTSERIYRGKKRYSPIEAVDIMKEIELDKAIFEKVKDTLLDAYLHKSSSGLNLPKIKDIEEERVNIFFKDYLTGTDRLVLFSKYVEEKIKRKENFYLFGVDVVGLGYINYKYGVNFGNKFIEALAEELMKSSYLLRIMRSGADSFVCLCPVDGLEYFYSFIEDVEDKLRFKFLNNEQDTKIFSSGLLYKTHVYYPKDGDTFEDLLYALRLRLKRLKFINYKSHLSF